MRAFCLIDFGCAKLVEDKDVITDVAGSPYYCAPEILSDTMVQDRSGVWKAADMWSIGRHPLPPRMRLPPLQWGQSGEDLSGRSSKGQLQVPSPL